MVLNCSCSECVRLDGVNTVNDSQDSSATETHYDSWN